MKPSVIFFLVFSILKNSLTHAALFSPHAAPSSAPWFFNPPLSPTDAMPYFMPYSSNPHPSKIFIDITQTPANIPNTPWSYYFQNFTQISVLACFRDRHTMELHLQRSPSEIVLPPHSVYERVIPIVFENS